MLKIRPNLSKLLAVNYEEKLAKAKEVLVSMGIKDIKPLINLKKKDNISKSAHK